LIDDATAKSPKAILRSAESERVALASATRFAGAPHAGRIPREAPTSVPDAVSIPARASNRIKNKAPPGIAWRGFVFNPVVESAGIEPASASTLQTVLHT